MYLQRQSPDLQFSSVVEGEIEHEPEYVSDHDAGNADPSSDSDQQDSNVRAVKPCLDFYADPKLNNFVKKYLLRFAKGRMTRNQGKEMWAFGVEVATDIDPLELRSYDTMERRVREVMPQPTVTWSVRVRDDGSFIRGRGKFFPQRRFSDKTKYQTWIVWTRLCLRELIMYHGGKHQNCDFVEDGMIVFNKVRLTVTFDGIPCANSSSDTLTVMGLRFHGCKYIYIPQARIACNKALKNIHDFLDPFIDQCNMLKVTVDFVVADAPMRSFLKCLKGHAGWYSCEVCEARGRCVHKKVCYPRTELHHPRRTHARWIMFLEDLEDQRKTARNTGDVRGITGRSPLLRLPGFNIVHQAPSDPMHRDWLGVVRNNLWRNTVGVGKSGLMNAKGKRITDAVNKVYLACRLPQEFTHKSRDIDHANFKAQEWKCLAMTCFPAICDIVNEEWGHQLAHVWCLFAYLIFIHYGPSGPREQLGKETLQQLHELLYDEFEDEFGASACTFNWHAFSHLPDVSEFGSPMDMSTENFESAYGLVQQSFAPSTRNRGLQIVRNMLLRSINHNEGIHCAHNLIVEPTVAGLRHDDSIVIDENLKFYKVQKVIGDEVIVFSMDTADWSCQHDPTLQWSLTGVKRYMGLIEREQKLLRSDIRGKGVLTDKNVLIPMYRQLIFS